MLYYRFHEQFNFQWNISLSENRSPWKSFQWQTGLWSLPGRGEALTHDRKGKQSINLQEKDIARVCEGLARVPDRHRQLVVDSIDCLSGWKGHDRYLSWSKENDDSFSDSIASGVSRGGRLLIVFSSGIGMLSCNEEGVLDWRKAIGKNVLVDTIRGHYYIPSCWHPSAWKCCPGFVKNHSRQDPARMEDSLEWNDNS